MPPFSGKSLAAERLPNRLWSSKPDDTPQFRPCQTPMPAPFMVPIQMLQHFSGYLDRCSTSCHQGLRGTAMR